MEERQRIYNLSTKLNDNDRQEIAALLIKAGYAVRIGRDRPRDAKSYQYFVEFWKEEDR